MCAYVWGRICMGVHVLGVCLHVLMYVGVWHTHQPSLPPTAAFWLAPRAPAEWSEGLDTRPREGPECQRRTQVRHHQDTPSSHHTGSLGGTAAWGALPDPHGPPGVQMLSREQGGSGCAGPSRAREVASLRGPGDAERARGRCGVLGNGRQERTEAPRGRHANTDALPLATRRTSTHPAWHSATPDRVCAGALGRERGPLRTHPPSATPEHCSGAPRSGTFHPGQAMPRAQPPRLLRSVLGKGTGWVSQSVHGYACPVQGRKGAGVRPGLPPCSPPPPAHAT